MKKIYDILFIGEQSIIEGYDLLSDALRYVNKKYSVKIISRKSNDYSITEKDLVKAYNQSRLVICLSRNEPFGLIPLDAMSCEVPVIALDEGGYKETILNNTTGFLIHPNPKILAEKINALLSDPQEIEGMGRNARTWIEKQWTWEKHIDSLLKII